MILLGVFLITAGVVISKKDAPQKYQMTAEQRDPASAAQTYCEDELQQSLGEFTIEEDGKTIIFNCNPKGE